MKDDEQFDTVPMNGLNDSMDYGDQSDLSSDDGLELELKSQMKAVNRKGKKSGGFQSMGLSYPVYKAITHQGYKIPTPIQRKTIPIIMEGRDVVAMARTGSGKTAAFLVPLVERLKAHSAKVGCRALILSPSRELATQTHKFCKELSKYTDLRCCLFVGGDNMDDQFAAIASNPDVIIATPGRLMHLMVEMRMDIKTVEFVVFDEADRLFEMGFAVQLHEILLRLHDSRQTLLFSATLPRLLVDFAKAGLRNPALIRLDVDTKISRDLQMFFFATKPDDKDGALLYLLRHCIPEGQQTVIFVSTKHHVEYIQALLSSASIDCTYVYGALDQDARKIHLSRFRLGKVPILVVTDVAARGIDVPLLQNVVNYDFPPSSKVFVHRVGRTARAGQSGCAWSLVSNDELPYMVDLQLFTGRPLVFASTFGPNKQQQATRAPNYTTELVYGLLPPLEVSVEIESAVQLRKSDITLQTLHESAVNGYKMYVKSRPVSAKASYARAKEISTQHIGIHPRFAETVHKSEIQRLEMVQSLSSFRPAETVFEVGKRGQKTAEALLMMKRRSQLGKAIETAKAVKRDRTDSEAAQQLKAIQQEEVVDDEALEGFDTLKKSKKQKKTDHRDTEVYMSYRPADADTEMGYAVNSAATNASFAENAHQATVDLLQDDPDNILKQKPALRWDSKKHRFTRATIGSDNKKRIRTETGTLIPSSFQSGRFDTWQKRTKTVVPRTGELELSEAATLARGRATGERTYRYNTVTAPNPTSKAFGRKQAQLEAKLRKEGKQGEQIKQALQQAREAAKQQFSHQESDLKRKKGVVKRELKNTGEIARARRDKEKRREKTGRHHKSMGTKKSRK